MPLVNYNPWVDAANVGQGIGQSLGQILMQQPQMRMQAARQQAELGQEQQRLQQQGHLNQAQIGELGARAALYRQNAQPVGPVQGLPQGTSGLDSTQLGAVLRGILQQAQAQNVGQRPTIIPRGGTAVMPGGQQIQGQSYQPRPQGPNLGQLGSAGSFVEKANEMGSETNPAIQAIITAITNQLPQQQQQFQPGAPAQPGAAMPQRPMRLDPATASQFLQQAGGDKDKARELARQAGYSF